MGEDVVEQESVVDRKPPSRGPQNLAEKGTASSELKRLRASARKKRSPKSSPSIESNRSGWIASHTQTQDTAPNQVGLRGEGGPNKPKIIPFSVNTHKSGSHAAAVLHGKLLNLIVHGEQEIADKVNSPRQLSPRNPLVATKITEERCGVRPLSPRKSVCQKITQADAVPLSPRFRYDVSGKITGDVLFQDPTCLRSIGGKVTEQKK